jgi:DNA transposition AAA+ family ATPase
MLAQWIGDFVGRMHRHRITITQISQEMDVTREYLSMILNGHREPSGIEERMNDALNRIIEKQNLQAVEEK